ncbi:MAG TPA: endonuclease/exonuclease/phosphatase family protein [Blastocatellia bacterium]|nr:endonuclease/exonuclease/phosphatase family protein [Blastocatellia bacterium]
MTLKLLSYNIRFGGAGREDQLAAVIRESEPDLVILQEAIKPHIVEQLAQRTGMNFWGARLGHSLGFISRVEVAHHQWHAIRGSRRTFLEVVPAGTEVRIFGVHLSAIHSNWTERRRVRELRALLASIKQHQQGMHVLSGDFNTLAPGELFDTRLLPLRLRPFVWLSGGYIRWETIQIMLDSGYRDGYRIAHPVEKGFTFPTWSPHIRLDYVFLPARFADRLKGCQVRDDGLAAAQASDHFPLLAELDIG